MNKKEYAQFLIDNAEIIEITASYRGEEKYEQNIKLEPNNNKTIPISKDILEIEIEEEITEDTVFKHMIEVRGSDHTTWNNTSIADEKLPNSNQFYAYIDEEYKLIWRDGKLVE